MYWPVISQCLASDPDRRPRTFLELLEAVKLVMKSNDVPVIDYIVKNDVASVEALIIRAANLRQLDLNDEATACLEQALRQDPQNEAALSNLGNLYADKGNHRKAIAFYRKAVDAVPGRVEPWFNLSLSYRESGQAYEGLEAAERAIEVQSESPFGYIAKGRCLMALGDCEGALRAFKSALELSGGNGRLWFEAGEALSCLSRSEEALQHYGNAVRLSPRLIRGWTYTAMELVRLKRNEDATSCLRALVSAYPEDASVLNEIGVAYTKIGECPTAIAYFDRALALRCGELEVPLANKGAAYYDM